VGQRRDIGACAARYPSRDFAGFDVGPIDAMNISHRLSSYEEDQMSGAALTFQIFGRSCVVILPPNLDGVPPANDVQDAAQDAQDAHDDAQHSGRRTPSGFQRIDAARNVAATAEAEGR
jgi:hypothetical protein